MALTITTNIESLLVQKNLNLATSSLNKSIERMTTGYRINKASDNAAGYSIATYWATMLGSLDILTDNTAMGIDLLSTAEENYSLLTSHLQRIRDLTEQAANGTFGSTSLKAIQAEIKSRLQEITRISANSEYNGIKLMAADTPAASSGIDLQVGLNSDNNSVVKLSSTLFADASVSGLFKSYSALKTIVTNANGSAVNYNTEEGYEALSMAFAGLKKSGGKVVIQTADNNKPKDTLTYLDQAINNISNRVTTIGSAQNRVSSAASAVEVQIKNITSSLSTIRDTDVAAESSRYVQEQILQQASATLLATANQSPSVALNLI